jgi:hypothetical protein
MNLTSGDQMLSAVHYRTVSYFSSNFLFHLWGVPLSKGLERDLLSTSLFGSNLGR